MQNLEIIQPMAKSVRKDSINEIEDALSLIRRRERLTDEQISVRLGHAEGYIRQYRSRGEYPAKFMKELNREFDQHKKITVASDFETTVKEIRQLKALVTVLVGHVAELETKLLQRQSAWEQIVAEAKTNLKGLPSLE